MKKLFTLIAAALCLCTSANAQTRKTWDFTKGWSDLTVYNLTQDAAAGTGWTNKLLNADGSVNEKQKASTPVYFESKKRSATGELTATVDGNAVVISETEGLKFNGKSAAHINIYSNKNGEGSVWINGKKAEDQIVIPNVPAGETVTIDFESHKSSEARGFKSITDNFTDADGNKQWTTKGRDTAVVVNNNTVATDYTIQATNGFHIYSIVIGSGDDPDAMKKKVAYIYTGDLTQDPAYLLLQANENIKVTALDATTTLTRDELLGYDVNVISSTVPADNANVALLKEVQPYEPTLNLNAALYNAWGYGEAVATEDVFGATSQASNPLFAGIELVSASEAGLAEGQSGVVFTTGTNPFTGVKLGSYYADDAILATSIDGSVVAIHSHNGSHNGYIFLPFDSNVLAVTEGSHAGQLLANAITNLAASKAEITATDAPTFDVHYGNRTATVKIESPAPYAQIYYTTDGTEPAIGTGTLYTEPLELTAETTVKAIVQGQGYNPSVVVDTLVRMYDQAAMPAISRVDESDATTITLSTTDADATIWYAFEATTDTTRATKYTAPFVLNDHCTLTAFATGAAYVPSEMNTQEIYIKDDKVYADIVSHFDANSNYGGNNGKGMFTWGTSATSQKDTGKDPIRYETDDDGLEVPVYPDRDPEYYPADYSNIDWVLTSQGQSLIWQNTNPGKDVGDDSNYNPASSADLDTLITKNDIQFYKHNGDEYNAAILSTKKFQGPFNVVMFMGTAGGSQEQMGIEASADGATWTVIGDTIYQKLSKRLWKKYTVSYTGTDEVYVRVKEYLGPNGSGPQVYDVYIMAEGENSKAIEAELAEKYNEYIATGISEVKDTKAAGKVVGVYSVNGTQLNKPQKGVNIIKYANGTARKVLVK